MMASLSSRLERVLRVVPDFPKPGILFRDITPLLALPALMEEVIDAMCWPTVFAGVTHVVGIESRGFLFGVPIALRLRAAFVPARKPGKLPSRCMRQEFALEYGTDALEMHVDALDAGARVLIVDDVLATGGTAAAACQLTERLGASVIGISVLGDIAALRDVRRTLDDRKVRALVSF